MQSNAVLNVYETDSLHEKLLLCWTLQWLMCFVLVILLYLQMINLKLVPNVFHHQIKCLPKY